jgi:hypothetical protein
MFKSDLSVTRVSPYFAEVGQADVAKASVGKGYFSWRTLQFQSGRFLNLKLHCEERHVGDCMSIPRELRRLVSAASGWKKMETPRFIRFGVVVPSFGRLFSETPVIC